MDRITLRGIVAHGKHGANPGERDRSQPFHLDVDLDLDLTAASESDDLHDTVNYADVHAKVVKIVEERSYVLLERVAAAIVDEILQDRRIRGVTVSIAKPDLLDGATPIVRIARENRHR